MYHEFLYPIYGDLSHSHIGGRIHSNIWSPIGCNCRTEKEFLHGGQSERSTVFTNRTESLNKPGLEVDLEATFSATSQLKVMLGYYFANERWTIANGQSVEMNSINNLNVGAIYNINDMFSINAKTK